MKKAKVNTGWIVKRWHVITAIVGMVVYTVGLLIAFFIWKTSVDMTIQNKVDEKTTTFLIDLGIGNLKTNIISDLQERVKYLERKK
jgi:hypothetical protein